MPEPSKPKALLPNYVAPGGRSGKNVLQILGPPNSYIRGGGDNVFELNDRGLVERQFSPERVKLREQHTDPKTGQDPTRVDIDVPASIQKAFQDYEPALKRYGRVLYAIYRSTDNRDGTLAAVTAMLDIMFEERGQKPLKEYEADARAIKSAWFDT